MTGEISLGGLFFPVLLVDSLELSPLWHSPGCNGNVL